MKTEVCWNDIKLNSNHHMNSASRCSLFVQQVATTRHKRRDSAAGRTFHYHNHHLSYHQQHPPPSVSCISCIPSGCHSWGASIQFSGMEAADRKERRHGGMVRDAERDVDTVLVRLNDALQELWDGGKAAALRRMALQHLCNTSGPRQLAWGEEAIRTAAGLLGF